jgi:hypothetical protein
MSRGLSLANFLEGSLSFWTGR